MICVAKMLVDSRSGKHISPDPTCASWYIQQDQQENSQCRVTCTKPACTDLSRVLLPILPLVGVIALRTLPANRDRCCTNYFVPSTSSTTTTQKYIYCIEYHGLPATRFTKRRGSLRTSVQPSGSTAIIFPSTQTRLHRSSFSRKSIRNLSTFVYVTASSCT